MGLSVLASGGRRISVPSLGIAHLELVQCANCGGLYVINGGKSKAEATLTTASGMQTVTVEPGTFDKVALPFGEVTIRTKLDLTDPLGRLMMKLAGMFSAEPNPTELETKFVLSAPTLSEQLDQMFGALFALQVIFITFGDPDGVEEDADPGKQY